MAFGGPLWFLWIAKYLGQGVGLRILFCIAIAGMLAQLGKRLAAPSAAYILRTSKSAPVLYLRSFEADADTTSAVGVLASLKAVLPLRVEERNVTDLKVLGPVIAVGRPGDRLPQPGAARLTLADDAWQGEIRNLIGKSQLIVFEAGGSSGLQWELAQAFAANPFKPILICVPFDVEDAILTKQEKYEVFRRALRTCTPEVADRLPDQLGNTTCVFFDRIDHFTEFTTTEGVPAEALESLRRGSAKRFRVIENSAEDIIFLPSQVTPWLN